MDNKEKVKQQIEELEKKSEELKRKMPAHSTPVSMMQDLEDLENELDRKKKELNA